MNSVLFAIVTALALEQVFACKVRVSRVGSASSTVSIRISDNSVETNFGGSMNAISVRTAYYEDYTWKELENWNLCDDNAEFAVFKRILYDVTGFESCTSIDKRDYLGKTEILYPDDVCTEVSELTNGNHKKLQMEFLSTGMTIISITLKVED